MNTIIAQNFLCNVAKKIATFILLSLSLCPSLSPQDLDTVVQVLLNKGGEANAFLREVVERAMGEMIGNVGASKALSALIMGGMR